MGEVTISTGQWLFSLKPVMHSDPDQVKIDRARFRISGALITFIALAAMICVFSTPAHAVTVEFNPATYTVNENAGTVTLTVTGTSPVNNADLATVGWTTANGGAIAGTNFGASGDTQQVTNGILPISLGWVIPFIKNVQSVTINIPILNDGKYNRPLSFTVTLRGLSVSNDKYGTNQTATVTINNVNPAPTVQFAATSYTVNENAGTATITVTKTGSTAISASVNYATSGGNATSGNYDSTSGTLTFAAGETSKTFTVQLHDDGLFDTQRYFNVVLSSPVDASLGTPNSIPVYINNVDAAPVVQLSATSYSVDENAGTAAITVTRTNDAAGAVTVDYATTDGTATAGTNYMSATGTVTFNKGEFGKTFDITILDDHVDDPGTQFTVTLSNPTGGATLGTQNTATVTVNNVDPAPIVQFDPAAYSVKEDASTVTITVTRTNDAVDPFTVNYATSEGTAKDGINYYGTSGALTFNKGEFTKTFDVTVIDDGLYEPDMQFTATLSSPTGEATIGAANTATVTVNNVDPAPIVQFDPATYSVDENAGTATITVTRTNDAAGAVTVNYATTDGTATAGTNYDSASRTLTFNKGEFTKTFDVTILDDHVYGPNTQFTVTLSNPTGGAATGTSDSATVTVNNVDPAPIVQLDPATYSVDENAGTATITVTRTNDAASAVTVDYATNDGTAVDGTNYNSVSGTLTFNKGEFTKTFDVTVIDDGLYGPDTQFTATISNPTGDATIGTQDTATVTVNNVDPAPNVQFDPVTYREDEHAAKATITVTRTNDAVDPITVDYATNDGTAVDGTNYNSVSGTLTFNKGEFTKTFDVTILDDHLYAPDTQFTVTISSPTGDATIGTQDTATVTVNNVDPAPIVQLDPVTYSVDENVGTVTITATRTNDAVNPVTVDYTTNDGTATAGTNYQSTTGTVTFNKGEISKTFDVTILDDNVYGPSTQFTVTLSNPTGEATIGTQDTATVTVNNVDPAPNVQFDPVTYSVDENAGTATITVTRTNDAVGPVTVDYTTSDGTATAGTNYNTASGTLTFNKGEFTKTFDVTVIDDGLYGPDTQFTATISNPTGDATIGTANTATVTVNNVDPMPAMGINAPDSVDENSHTTITFHKDGNTKLDATFDVIVTDTAGSGLASVTPTSVTFGPGDTTESIQLDVTGDGIIATRSVTLSFGNAINCNLPDTMVITVNNTDASAYTIPLKQGWNLISFPVVNTTLRSSSLKGTGILIVSSYNRSNGDYDSFNTNVSPLSYDITMKTDVGYFVYCTQDTSLIVIGKNPVERSTMIYHGWNLIGWSSFNKSDAKGVVGESSLDGNQTLAKFNANTGDYSGYAEGSSPDPYNFATTDGVGYFIYTNSTTPQTLYYEV